MIDTTARSTVLDTVRGFALLGICVTNMNVASAFWSIGGTDGDWYPLFDGTADHLTDATVIAFFSGRFYLLFAFLFGYAFTLQIAAAERAGVPPAPRLVRRCLALLTLGVLHVELLWLNDILTLFGALGLLLVALRGIGDRTALILAGALLVAWTALWLLPDNDTRDVYSVLDLPGYAQQYAGSFSSTLAAQTELAPFFLILVWVGQAVPSFAMFLLGLVAGRRGLLTDTARLRHRAPWVLVGGLAVGVPVSAVTFANYMGWWDAPDYWWSVQGTVDPLMAAAYLSGIALLATGRSGARVTAILAPAGRMAASNYIAQSVLLMLVLTGYGFALADELPPLAVLGVSVLIVAALYAASGWWLARHPYGPVEWLLRAVTYNTLPPWRIA
ncbi:DUF418 domain-containing protein [Nocardia asteroides]|uniref:DUF418 domain-containing protein n=1 Tax=Nocardia asteroides TaxID=1824 RepID=UPI001E3D6287|nr:DUF418 domain-containing protein [Nocardia asteroides]UGT62378.1 DUF418 domain-containing protein [Nocardia asteroides]